MAAVVVVVEEEAILMMLVMGLYDVEGLYLYSNSLAGHTELKTRISMDSDLRLPRIGQTIELTGPLNHFSPHVVYHDSAKCLRRSKSVDRAGRSDWPVLLTTTETGNFITFPLSMVLSAAPRVVRFLNSLRDCAALAAQHFRGASQNDISIDTRHEASEG